MTVYPWPESRHLIPTISEAALNLLVIRVVTPITAVRHTARAQLRGALRAVLALQHDCTPESIELVSLPGRAISVDLPGHQIGLSASHELGISVAAIHRGGPVGIDILQLTGEFDWLPVAHDYLGLHVAAKITSLPPREQLAEFARQWTRLEACLKCLGIGLQEWSLSLEHQLSACRLIDLELPSGLFGAVACARVDESFQSLKIADG